MPDTTPPLPDTEPLISIITISFNQLEFLKMTVASVRSQNYKNIEHIIVDPGSTDGSREWLRSIDRETLKLHFEADRGPADGLNRGLDLATGELVIYLNSDDELAPGALRSIAETHRESPDSDIIIGNGWLINETGEPLKHVTSDTFTPTRYCMAVGTILQQSTTFKGSVFRNGLRFNPENRINWDTELVFDAYRSKLKISKADADWGYFRMQPESITVSGRFAELYAKEEERLRRSQVSPAFYTLSGLLRVPARGLKFAKTRLSELTNRPVFPGLSR